MLALVAVGLLAGAACGGDDDGGGDNGGDGDAGGAQEVEDVVFRLATVDPTIEDDVEFFFEHVTDRFFEGTADRGRDECEAEPVDCIGEPPEEVSVEDVTVDGDTASARVVGDEITVEMLLVREDGVWKVDALAAPDGDTTGGE